MTNDQMGASASASADLVSIIIPCYNQGQFLEECLASVAAQDYPALEVIVVDDGSGPATKAVILRLAAERAFSLLTQPNRGLSAARNAGIRAAHGRFVLPLDADNRLAPDAVTRLVATWHAAHARDPRIGYVYQDKVWFGAEERYVPHSEFNLYMLLQENFCDAAALMERSLFTDLNVWYDERMRAGFEDWELFLRLAVYHRWGVRLAGQTLEYRRWGFTMVDVANERRAELVAYIRRQVGALYFPPVQAAIKARWSPGATVVVGDAAAAEGQTMADREVLEAGDEPAALQALRQARGKYWLMVAPGDEAVLAEDPCLLDKGIGFLEREPHTSAIRFWHRDHVAARLINGPRLLASRPVLAEPSLAALDAALDQIYPVPLWDVARQTWTRHRTIPVAVPERPVRPRRSARWVKNFGKRWIVPRIGFERAAGIYFHQREVWLLLAGRGRPPVPPPPGRALRPPRAGGFSLEPPDAREPGRQVERAARLSAPVPLAPPREGPDALAGPPLDLVRLHQYRHAPIAGGASGRSWGPDPAPDRSRRALLVLGFDQRVVKTCQQRGDTVVVADLSLAGIDAAKALAPTHDLMDWRPGPVFDEVVVSEAFAAALGPEAARLAESAARPRATVHGVAVRYRRPRVLVVAPYLVTGGADRAVLDLLPALAAAFDVWLATTEPSDNPWVPQALGHVREYWDVGALASTDEARQALVAALVETRRVDAVYIMHSRVGFDALPRIRRTRAVPVVAQFHLEEPWGHGGWAFYALSRYANLIDRVVTVSHQLARRLESAYYVPPDRLCPIHLGVLVPAAIPPLPTGDRLQVLYPARLAPQKAPLTLLLVAAGLRAQQVPATIHVLGDGPLRSALADGIAKQRLQPWLVLHDFVPPDGMDAWYARSHVTLLTSAWEGLPLVLLESMGRGRPVIASDVGAVSEVVTPKTGWLIADPDDVDAYVAAIAAAAANRAQLVDRGRAGRELVEREFDPAATNQAYVSLFDDLW